MKKLVVTAAIVLGITLGAAAQNRDGGLFGKGETSNEGGTVGPALPVHGQTGNEPAGNENPLGGGALLLIGFGAAYVMGKRKHE